MNPILSRRDFLKIASVASGGIAVTSSLLLPSLALASENSSNMSNADILWKEAKERILAAGGKIYTEPAVFTDGPVVASYYQGWCCTSDMTINGLTDAIACVCEYNASSYIISLSNTYLYSRYGKNTVSNLSKSYGVDASGKTLCIRYGCTLTQAILPITSYWSFYAEFYTDGTGWITA